jgi:hypothetical protein
MPGILADKEFFMAQTRIMTLKEKTVIGLKALEAKNRGDEAEYMRIMKEEMPMPPYLAKWAKNHMGADFLIEHGWNLAEADAEYGPGWLDR